MIVCIRLELAAGAVQGGAGVVEYTYVRIQ
jgi:hypothetical protein